MHVFEKQNGTESWTNNIKQTIKTDQAHIKENQMELLEINNNNRKQKFGID